LFKICYVRVFVLDGCKYFCFSFDLCHVVLVCLFLVLGI